MKKKWSRLRTVLTGVAGIFAIALIYALFNGLVVRSLHPAEKSTVVTTEEPTQAPVQKGPVPQGVPLPADQILQPPP